MKKTLLLITYYFYLKAFCYATFARQNHENLLDFFGSIDVRYYLYTKQNPQQPQELFINNEESVKNSYFNNSKPTKIIIHGWLASYKITPNIPIRDAYLSQDDFNIIAVDWEKAAGNVLYFPAVLNVPTVGQRLADFVDYLNEKFTLNMDSLVIIGHSLGAHVAGYCGKLLKRGRLSYIVGLDPASPLYSYNIPERRLSDTDAKYVVSIQTNGKFNGFRKPIGHASFYANWGYQQPGCENNNECSHLRSIELYAEAIRGYSFQPIYKCNSYDEISKMSGCSEVAADVKLGDPTDNKAEGIFNFATNSEKPYGHM